MINIGVIDDHAVIAQGVTALLNAEKDIEVVATATSPNGLPRPPHPYDVVLLDLSLGDGSTTSDNVAAVSKLAKKVIAFTSGEQPHLIREATRAGVAAVVRKSAPPQTLVSAIRAVHGNTAVPDAEWAAALEADRGFVATLLTPREVEVLALYAGGEPAKRVARALFISEDTVIDHIRNIRAKYADQDRPVSSKIDLFRRAVEDGILRIDD
ncbi:MULTISPECIES: response regulator transcription factor [unclassified Leucobacter]|uniref:response regulator transcription factor n=1 Tax=unclassified Leucobacter TaxID=2621730 RepID=UPI003018E750